MMDELVKSWPVVIAIIGAALYIVRSLSSLEARLSNLETDVKNMDTNLNTRLNGLVPSCRGTRLSKAEAGVEALREIIWRSK